jgi:hypothetical protein
MIVDIPFQCDNILDELVFQTKSRDNRGYSHMTRAGRNRHFGEPFAIRFVSEARNESAAISGERQERATGRTGIELVPALGATVCRAL